jgi:hypothetical protein
VAVTTTHPPWKLRWPATSPSLGLKAGALILNSTLAFGDGKAVRKVAIVDSEFREPEPGAQSFIIVALVAELATPQSHPALKI